MPAPELAFFLATAALLSAATAGAATLTRGPYLQLLTTHSVTVVWKTDTPAICSLTIRPVDGSPREITGQRSTACALPVPELAIGTSYAYVPRADGTTLGDESTFRTDGAPGPFVFLVLGDSGDGGPNQRAVRERMLATPADFVVHTGDMVYPDGEAENYDPVFFTPYRDILRRLVLWPCLGNHDVRTAGGAPWRDAFYTPANNPARDEGYYSFEYGNAHVVVLDSNASTSPGSPQYTFLAHDLDTTRARWTFVVLHHTMYSSSHHGSDLSHRAHLVPLFDAHAVDVVFMGHDHGYERTVPLHASRQVEPGAGTVYVTTAGGGRKLYEAGHNDFTAYAESAFHLTRAAVNGGTLRLEMIRADGAVRDTFSVTKPDPSECRRMR